MPQLAIDCIKSWRIHCPDYEICFWNESNINISENAFSSQAYKAKKFGFVTDYFRLKVLYENGGIYLDTDVEVIKSFDSLLCNDGFFGFEDESHINTGLGFGATLKNPILLELMKSYENALFINEDGSYNLTPCPQKDTLVFINRGLLLNNSLQVIDGIKFLPTDFLCPIDFSTGKKNITNNTYSVHHFMGSWLSPVDKAKFKIIRSLNFIFGKNFAKIIIKKLRKIIKILS